MTLKDLLKFLDLGIIEWHVVRNNTCELRNSETFQATKK